VNGGGGGTNGFDTGSPDYTQHQATTAAAATVAAAFVNGINFREDIVAANGYSTFFLAASHCSAHLSFIAVNGRC
jgi:hypothetical protein